jgi:hypothetical protein
MIRDYFMMMGSFALLVYLRNRHIQSAGSRPRDATMVNLNFLMGAMIVLFIGKVLIDVFRP